MDRLIYAESGAGPEDVDWDDFRVFLEIVRSGSFNRAAVTLKMTQSTVSRRLARLGDALGVRLFDRDRRGPRLTTEGQRIYNEACAAQVALTRAASEAPGARRGAEGDCKLLMGEGVATYWISRFLTPFFTRHPNIELKVFGTNDRTADKCELFDLNLHYSEPTESEPVAVRLGTLHFVPFASRNYLRLHGAPQNLEDLARHRLLDLSIYMPEMGSWASWSRGEAATHAVVFTNLTGVVAEGIRHGAGIALLPTYAMLVDDRFVPLEIGIRCAVPIYVSYQRDASKKWPVRTTLEFLRNCVFDRKNMPWFRESYHTPEMDWHKRLAVSVEGAAAPPDGDNLPANAAA